MEEKGILTRSRDWFNENRVLGMFLLFMLVLPVTGGVCILDLYIVYLLHPQTHSWMFPLYLLLLVTGAALVFLVSLLRRKSVGEIVEER